MRHRENTDFHDIYYPTRVAFEEHGSINDCDAVLRMANLETGVTELDVHYYPPTFHVFFAPFALIPYRWSRILFLLFNHYCLFHLLWILYRFVAERAKLDAVARERLALGSATATASSSTAIGNRRDLLTPADAASRLPNARQERALQPLRGRNGRTQRRERNQDVGPWIGLVPTARAPSSVLAEEPKSVRAAIVPFVRHGTVVTNVGQPLDGGAISDRGNPTGEGASYYRRRDQRQRCQRRQPP